MRVFRMRPFVKPLVLIGIAYVGGIALLTLLLAGVNRAGDWQQYTNELYATSLDFQVDLATTSAELASVSAQLKQVLAEDQRVKNAAQEAELKNIQTTYRKAVVVYEDLVKLRESTTKTAAFDEAFTQALTQLTKKDFLGADGTLNQLQKDIDAEQAKIAASFSIPANVPVNNSPPGSGYSRQQVQIDIGTYLVSIVSADLNSTRVIVDTASDATCTNDCPVMALGDYVSRSGGFAGINGPYFCPATYPSCADKKNAFDTLIMNKNKVYFNSDNNVYSTVPAVIFSGSSARFVGRTSDWGRDTGVDSVIAAQPFLVSGGNVAFGGDGDPKKGSKSTRGFIGVTGSTVYIGHVHNATVAESARVVQGLGIQNALNLDGGGSVALWSGGYKVGPGRNLPFGIVLVRK